MARHDSRISNRREKNLRRRNGRREPGKRILIICDGEKTEPLYFEEFKRSKELHSLSIEIVQGSGISPRQIVEQACNLASSAGSDKFDFVFCVFDQDTHSTFDEAIRKCQSSRYKKLNIRPVYSIPCFEYFILLHFEYTTSLFLNCESVIQRLRVHLPSYSKSSENSMNQIVLLNESGVLHSRRANAQAHIDMTTNPRTLCHEIFDVINNLSG